MSKDREALIFVPVMNDVRQHVGIPAGRCRFEEITGLDRHTIADAFCLEQWGCFGHHMRKTEPARFSIRGEDGGKKFPRPTADINDGFEGRKIISGGDGWRLLA